MVHITDSSLTELWEDVAAIIEVCGLRTKDQPDSSPEKWVYSGTTKNCNL